MHYGLDLTQFPLSRLRQQFEAGDVLPARHILTEHIPERFAALEAAGIATLQDLIDALKTKKKLAAFAEKTGLPDDYLIMLRREANSYVPKPVTLVDILGVDADHAERLAATGITHTKHLFARGITPEDRAALAQETGVPEAVILELVQLADLARVGYLGPVFVRLIHAAGAHTLADLAQKEPAAFYAQIQAINAEHGYTKGTYTFNDVTSRIHAARELPPVIVY